jgi:hypothetical protein
MCVNDAYVAPYLRLGRKTITWNVGYPMCARVRFNQKGYGTSHCLLDLNNPAF